MKKVLYAFLCVLFTILFALSVSPVRATTVSWDVNFPDAEDCDGYDADGDWCDQETSVVWQGIYSLGVRGSGTTKYAIKNLSSSASECYVEYAYYTTAPSTGRILALIDSGNNDVFRPSKDGDNTLIINIGATAYDTGHLIPQTNWYRIGIYYKEETGDGNNDGIARIWIRTDTSDFTVDDLIYSNTSLDTPSNDCAKIKVGGPYAGYINYFDNIKVTSGEPSWPIE